MTRRRKGKRLPPLLLPPLQVQSQLLVAPCRRLLHPRPGIDGRTQNSCPRRLGDHLHNLEPSRSSTCEKQGGTQACRRMTTSLTEHLTRRHSRLWTSRNSRSHPTRPLHSATQTYGPPPILKRQTRSCAAHFYSTEDRCWHGSGGGGSTIHCYCNDLEVSRTYGSTQTSTPRMLRERLVYGTP